MDYHQWWHRSILFSFVVFCVLPSSGIMTIEATRLTCFLQGSRSSSSLAQSSPYFICIFLPKFSCHFIVVSLRFTSYFHPFEVRSLRTIVVIMHGAHGRIRRLCVSHILIQQLSRVKGLINIRRKNRYHEFNHLFNFCWHT